MLSRASQRFECSGLRVRRHFIALPVFICLKPCGLKCKRPISIKHPSNANCPPVLHLHAAHLYAGPGITYNGPAIPRGSAVTSIIRLHSGYSHGAVHCIYNP